MSSQLKLKKFFFEKISKCQIFPDIVFFRAFSCSNDYVQMQKFLWQTDGRTNGLTNGLTNGQTQLLSFAKAKLKILYVFLVSFTLRINVGLPPAQNLVNLLSSSLFWDYAGLGIRTIHLERHPNILKRQNFRYFVLSFSRHESAWSKNFLKIVIVAKKNERSEESSDEVASQTAGGPRGKPLRKMWTWLFFSWLFFWLLTFFSFWLFFDFLTFFWLFDFFFDFLTFFLTFWLFSWLLLFFYFLIFSFFSSEKSLVLIFEANFHQFPIFSIFDMHNINFMKVIVSRKPPMITEDGE